MADFDVQGLGKVRMTLTRLSKEPSIRGNDSIKREVIKEFYPEIRAARLAGHAWGKIRIAIIQDLKMKLSEGKLIVMFSDIDKEYEEKTGVKALPQRAPQNQKKKLGRPRKMREE